VIVESTTVVESELGVEISRILKELVFGEEVWCLLGTIESGVNHQEAEWSCWGS